MNCCWRPPRWTRRQWRERGGGGGSEPAEYGVVFGGWLRRQLLFPVEISVASTGGANHAFWGPHGPTLLESTAAVYGIGGRVGGEVPQALHVSDYHYPMATSSIVCCHERERD